MEVARCLLFTFTRPVSTAGSWFHGCSSDMLVEHVVLLPECQFWVLRPSPQVPVFAQGTAVAPFYEYFTRYSHSGGGELG